MFINNDPGLYPSVMIHRSHSGQLAIGGAMINRVHEDSGMAEVFEAVPASGGWYTRFDGGSMGTRILDMPCDLVAMYVEGLIHIYGGGGGDLGLECDSVDVEINPSCYALVVYRWKERKDLMGKVVREAGERYVYLQSHFSFTDRVANDGVYDLKEAHEVARTRGLSWDARYERRKHLGSEQSRRHRDWHLVAKKDVPGHIRQLLHRTIDSTRTSVDEQFGQGKKFFKLPTRK